MYTPYQEAVVQENENESFAQVATGNNGSNEYRWIQEGKGLHEEAAR